MTTPTTIALIVGSLRKASINRKFAEYIVSQLPNDIEVYLGHATDSLDDAGHVSERTQKFTGEFAKFARHTGA